MMNKKNIQNSSAKLATVLCRQLGDSRVIVDADVLESYSRDKSHCDGALPDLVVRAKSEDEIAKVVKAAAEFEVPVTARGAGTGKSGGAIPVQGGVVLDLTRMNALLEVDRENMLAVVQPGIITGEMQSQLENEGLFYPPDPNSLDSCTIGGNVAHNAGGPRAFKYGVTKQYVMSLRSILASGEVISSGTRTVKGVAGYNLTSLLVGSEGTLGIFSQITLKLIRQPVALSTILIPMPSEEAAGVAVARIVAAGLVPRVLEFMDSTIVSILRSKGIAGIGENTGSLILAEVDGDSEQIVEASTLHLADLCEKSGAGTILMAKHGGDREKLWAARRLMSDAVAETARYKVSEDIVVPRSMASQLFLGLKQIAEKHLVTVASYGHAGDGNYHVNVLWNDDGFKPIGAIRDIFELTLSLGGTITGEHGVGLSKKEFLPMEQNPQLISIQRAIKKSFDPKGILNPGKIFL